MHTFNVLNSLWFYIDCIDVHVDQARSKHVGIMANCVKKCNFNAFIGFIM